MEQFADSYALAADAQALTRALILSVAEFAPLGDARIACILSQRVPTLHGHPCKAWIADPRVQGPFKHFFDWALAQFCAPLFEREDPDYVVMIDAAVWSVSTEEQRERLIYHELCHLQPRENAETGAPMFQDDGRRKLTLVPHDYEAFDAEIRRYGPTLCDLEPAAAAIAAGFRDAQVRAKRGNLKLA